MICVPFLRRSAALTLALASACLANAAAPMPAASANPDEPHAVASGTGQVQVEIVVFQYAHPGAAENWQGTPAGRGFGTGGAHAGAGVHAVRILGAGSYRLSGIEPALAAHGLGHVIAHAAWIQTTAGWGTHAGISLASVGITQPQLTGQVFVERAPVYLHVGVDLRLTGSEPYTIKDMHGARYDVRQYFDHPAFGAVVVVSPLHAASAPAAPTQ